MKKSHSTVEKKLNRLADSENQKLRQETIRLNRLADESEAEHRALMRENWRGLLAKYELPDDSEGDAVLLSIFRQRLRLKGINRANLSKAMAALYPVPRRVAGKLLFVDEVQ